MRKVRCYKNSVIGVVFLFVIIGLFSLFDITTGSLGGVKEPSTVRTIISFSLAILIFIVSRFFCVDPIVYKCIECSEVFDELKLEDLKCTQCKGDLLDIETYYKNKNKNRKDES